MSLARFSVNNPVIANLIMISIFALGGYSLWLIPREVRPEINLNWAFINVAYPGVTPEEIEKLIAVPIEEEIQDVKGIDTISSNSLEGLCILSVKFKDMPDDVFRSRFQDLRNEVDKVTDLPEDALDPEIIASSSADFSPVISVHVYGEIPEKKLIELGKDLKDKLIDLPGVSKAELSGNRDREIWVEADPVRLEGYGLSPELIQWSIAGSGLNVPGGKVSFGRQEVLVRTAGEFESIDDVKKVIVRSMSTGQMVRVSDVATVRETFEEAETTSRLNGKPAVSIAITKTSEGNSIAVVDVVKEAARAFEKEHGNLIDVAFTMDSSKEIENVMGKLTNNALVGFVVVILVLLVFLGIRNAMLTSLGIPISFLACFMFLFASGGSFNGNSLFALVLVLGVIVDDAIVIVENCYRHLQMGKSWKQAAVDGTREVMMPVISATATTVAVFLPTMMMPGIMGKFLRVIPITVSLALAASLIEAFIILPAHFADWPGKKIKRDRKPSEWFTSLLDTYEVGLRFVIKRRYIIGMGLPIILLVGAFYIVQYLGVDMFTGEEVAIHQVRVTMPVGTNLKTTAETLAEFEKKIATLPKTELKSIHTTAGRVIAQGEWAVGSNVGEIWLDLTQSYERDRSAKEIMNDVREKIKNISGPVNIEIARMPTGPPMGKPIEIKVKGKYFDQLKAAALEIKQELETIDGALDVGIDFYEGKKEVRFKVDPERAAIYGLDARQVGMAIRNAINGVTADTMYDGDEEIDIVVRLQATSLSRPEDFLKLPLLTRTGKPVTLGNVASFTVEPIYSEIKRYKQQRVITVFGNVDKEKTTGPAVNQLIQERFEHISKAHPGVTLDFSGEFKEFLQSFYALLFLAIIGGCLVYVILGAQFKSYIQPIVILLIVPMAFVGAGLGLLISNNPFSISTMFGIIALAGIAVNDAIVLITFINNNRAAGMEAIEAVVTAARQRLRPIILTSVTTIAGLVPMAIGLGGKSLTWSPLANTIMWGLAVSTLLTLFLIPAAYTVIVGDIADRFKKAPDEDDAEALSD
jgi:multidrug efflux pump